jgi:sporulation protein YlmC with PRC-barrel domain
MLHTLNDLSGFAIQAIDGNIGTVKDFYFDDRRWVIRHLVVETGSWLESHKVLLAPTAIKHLNRENKTIIVDLTVDEVKASPHIDTDKPVSQQYDIDYLSYYGYAFYWGANNIWDSDATLNGLVEENPKAQTFAAIDRVRRMHGDRHLRSCDEIINYHIQASDGEIGHLQEMLIDEDTWKVNYFIANTSNWWLGHQVLIDPQEITDISWGNAKIYVNMTQQQVQNAPLFDPEVPRNREQELGVYLHYDRDGYWEGDTKSKHV